MSLRLITAPTDSPIALADMKLHLRVDHSDEDVLIQALIDTATRSAEHMMGRAIMHQHWQLKTDSFEDLVLRKPVVSAVTHIKYINIDGTLTTLDPSVYQAVLGSEYEPYVTLAHGQEWPLFRSQPECVQVTFTTGYALAASVEAPIITWVKLCVTALYENRASVTDKQTYSLGLADRLLDEFTVAVV